MKKNRRRKGGAVAHNVIFSNTMHIGGVAMMIFLMAIVNMLAESSCTQRMKLIGQKERQLVRLEEECERENTRWEELHQPERLERALFNLGMDMKPARSVQIVRMNEAGEPLRGQYSVSVAMRRRARHTVEARR